MTRLQNMARTLLRLGKTFTYYPLGAHENLYRKRDPLDAGKQEANEGGGDL